MRSGTGRERGAALMVAMVMIFMLSLMGVSAMRGSSLERRMTDNAVQAETVRQAAESATEVVLNTPGSVADAIAAGSAGVVRVVDLGHAGMTTRVELRHVGSGIAPGTSLGSGIQASRVTIRGIAEIDGVSAAAAVSQGAYQKAPGL